MAFDPNSPSRVVEFMVAISRLRILIVLGTLTLSLAAEVLANTALQNPAHGWRLVQLLFAASLFVTSGGSFMYIGTLLESARERSGDPAALRTKIKQTQFPILKWGGVYGVPFLICGVALIID